MLDASPKCSSSGAQLDLVSGDFLGLDTSYPTTKGLRRRTYLDSGASCLMMGVANRAQSRFMGVYANSHSTAYHSAKISTGMYRWARLRVLEFLGLDPQRYSCIFCGSGATAALQRFAEIATLARPNRQTVVISSMEHHSNDLPHRQAHLHYEHVPISAAPHNFGALDLGAMASILEGTPDVNYVAVTAASNVTGFENDLAKIRQLSNESGALLLVDAAQAVAHIDLSSKLKGTDIDAIAFSGHKVYVPGSPGVLVIKNDLLESVEINRLGGGVVDYVGLDEFTLTDSVVERFEPGTPNIVGAVGIAFALETLSNISMKTVVEHEQALLQYLLAGLAKISGIEVYGSQDLSRTPRVGTVCFNVQGVAHGQVARALSQRYAIEVRNHCFCAQPYVRALIQETLWETLDPDDEKIQDHLGMVRVSLGLYNTQADIDLLLNALHEISQDPVCEASGESPQSDWDKLFSPDEVFTLCMREAMGSALSEELRAP